MILPIRTTEREELSEDFNFFNSIFALEALKIACLGFSLDHGWGFTLYPLCTLCVIKQATSKNDDGACSYKMPAVSKVPVALLDI